MFSGSLIAEEVQVVVVVDGRGGASGMPDSGAAWNRGGGRGGGRLSFQTLRQEARQSPEHTHTHLH